MTRHLFIINDYSNTHPNIQRMKEVADDILDGEVEFAHIGVTNDYIESIRRAGDSGEDVRVYACGGDGTLNAVIQHTMGYDNISVTNFALGTGNDYLKRFDDPSRFHSIEEFSDVRESKVDVIKMNGMYSANVLCFGLDARVCETYEKLRRFRFLRRFGYHIGCVVCIIKGVSQRCRVELDNGFVHDGLTTFVCVCNNGWYGGSYHPAPEANVKDGYLDVIVCKKISHLTMIRVIGKYKRGERSKISPKILEHHRVKSLHITPYGAAPFNLDGELVTAEDGQIDIVPEGMRFFYPSSVREIDP